MELIEITPGIGLDRDILQHMGFKPIMKYIRQMDPGIFREIWDCLAGAMQQG